MNILEKNGFLFAYGNYFMGSFSTAKLFPPKERLKIINAELSSRGQNEASGIYDLYIATTLINGTICYAKSKEMKLAIADYTAKIKRRGVANLGLYILERLKNIQLVAGLKIKEDMPNIIVCYQITIQQYGYVFIRNGTLYNKESELVASKEIIMKTVLSLIEEYNSLTNVVLKVVAVVCSAEFADFQESLQQSGVKYIPLAYDDKHKKFKLSSDDIFWKPLTEDQFKKARFKQVWDIKKLINNTLIALLAVIAISWLYQRFITVIIQDYFNPPELIKAPVAESGYAKGSELVNKCFADLGNLFDLASMQGKYKWYIEKFNCAKNGLTITFATKDSVIIPALGLADLIAQTNNKKIKLLSSKSGGSSYSLTKVIKLNTNYNYLGENTQLAENLNAYANKLDLQVIYSKLQTKLTFVINSKLSPIYLVNMQMLADVPLSAINGTFIYDADLFKWEISGGY